jgi:hypothetical protein
MLSIVDYKRSNRVNCGCGGVWRDVSHVCVFSLFGNERESRLFSNL